MDDSLMAALDALADALQRRGTDPSGISIRLPEPYGEKLSKQYRQGREVSGTDQSGALWVMRLGRVRFEWPFRRRADSE
jgi:hypothetical protein